MTRDASFWTWYAETNDDIRHELIERGWYGREVTGAHDQSEMTPPDSEPSIWEAGEDAPQGEGIHQGADPNELYGEADDDMEPAAQVEAPQIEPPEMEQE